MAFRGSIISNWPTNGLPGTSHPLLVVQSRVTLDKRTQEVGQFRARPASLPSEVLSSLGIFGLGSVKIIHSRVPP